MIALLSACAPSGALDVEVSGCAWTSPGPTCHITAPTDLVWWVGGDDEPRGVGTWAAADGGFVSHLRVERTRTVDLRTRAGRQQWGVSMETSLVGPVAEARTAEQAVAALAAGLDHASAGQWFELAWAAERRGLPGWDAARVEREAVAREAWWWAVRAALKEAYAANVNENPALTLDAVERARDYRQRAGHPLGFDQNYAMDFTEGLGHLAAGNHRRADTALHDALNRADRLGQSQHAGHARRTLAQSLVRAGATEEALAMLRAEPAFENPCAESDRHNALAWALMQAREAGSAQQIESPRPLLEQALAALRSGPCGQAYFRGDYESHTWLNLALVEAWDGNVAAAAHALARSREVSPKGDGPWALEVEARLALLSGRPEEAIGVYRRLAERAGSQLELQWMAERGTGVALSRLGRSDESIAALQRAQTLFFRQGLLVPLQLGRAAYYAQREQSTIELAEALLARGDAQAAFDAFRNQRAQYLTGLHQTARLNATRSDAPPAFLQALSDFRAAQREQSAIRTAMASDPADPALAARRASDLEALEQRAHAALDAGNLALGLNVSSERRRAAPGELLIGWFPARDRWVGFAESVDGVTVASWPGTAPPAVGDLLVPFAAAIGHARTVTLLPYGPLDAVDLQAASVDGAPVLARAPVRFGLDLDDAPAPAEVRSALIVAVDRTGTLGGAFDTVDPTAQALTALGWKVETLVGPAATVDAVLARLPAVDWFDFAGHGTGGDRWDNTLALHDGTLGVDDILALPHVPAVAVLNACETNGTGPGAVGLAQAFVAAGATAALATTRVVEDDLAALFATRLYEGIARDEPLTDAYRVAVFALSQERPNADWATFRLVVP